MQQYKCPIISAQLRTILKGHSSSTTSHVVGQLLANSSTEVPSDTESIHTAHISKAQLWIDLSFDECFVIIPKYGKMCHLERSCTFLDRGCYMAVSHLPLWSR